MGAPSLPARCLSLLILTASAVSVFSQLEGQLIDFHPSVMATSSSQRSDDLYSPQWAIEGSSERDRYACFFSKNQTGPWWRLDLTTTRGIFNVRVVSALNPSLPDGLVVYVSNGSAVNTTDERAQCGDSFSSSSGVEVTTFDCNSTLVGRYVYITTSTTTQLALCEVILNVKTGSSMALDLASIQAEAIQSPGNSGNRTADLAIDGNFSYSEQQCSSTTTGSNPFLRVNLKHPHLVKWVSVKFYGAGGNNLSVQVGSNLLDAGNYQCGNVLSYQTNSEDFYSFTCGEAQLGQYVIVTSTDTAPLQVCEVQVFTDLIMDIYLPGSVTAASQLYETWEMWKAVDRFRSTEKRACYRSVRNEIGYWKLELANFMTISMIKITSLSREDFRDELIESRAFVGNKTTNNGQDNVLCGTVMAIDTSVFIYIQCNNTVTGKYIYLISGSKGHHSLVLCEVELYKPGAPVITVQQQSQQVYPGTNVSLTCSAAGTPKLTSITWKLGNTSASGKDICTSDVMLNETNRMSTLNLTNVGRTTSGNYTCEVTNSEGTVTSSAAVITVLYVPTVTAVISPIVVLRGTDAILQVTVTGASPDVPNDSKNRTWFNPNATLITADSKYIFSSDRYNLTIKEVSLNDEGTYTFTAANTVGQNTVTIALTVEAAPVVTTPPTGLTVNASQTAIFLCVITGSPQPTIMWERDGKPLSRAGKIGIVERGTATTNRTSTLTVTNVTVEDAGSYFCKANNSRGHTSSQAAVLIVQVKPSVSVISAPTIREGRTATLQVTITSAIPMVANSTSTREWKFLNGSAISSNSRYSISTDRFALSISVVTLTDSGDYTFQATNAAGSGTANVALTVTSGRPLINAQPNSTEVNAGGTINFSCSAKAYPRPDFTWKSGATNLTADESIAIGSLIGNDPYTSTLTLKTVKSSDAGSYSCVVTNTRGTASSQAANLTVYVKPDVSAVSPLVTESVGAAAVLQVNVTGANPIVANQDKSWKKGNNELTGAKYSFSTDRLTLTIKSLVIGDAGAYTFTASNRAGSGTATITVAVQGFPVITQQPTFDPNPVNETGTLIGTCKATAAGSDPKPSSFKWYKDEVELSAGGRISISATTDGSDLVGTLMITAVMSSDDGNYKCTAVSSAGNTISVSVKVTVQIAPKISVSPTHDTAVEGDATESEFELTITNADVATPAVTKTDTVWKYEGNVISQRDGYRFSGSNDRVFIPVRESFAGQYSVEVTNAAGRATAVFNLSVLVPVRIERFLSNLTVNETNSFILNCTVHGVPTPQVSLYRVSAGTDQKIRSSETESGNAFNGNPYIAYTVAQSTGSDSGKYRCSAENEVTLKNVADKRKSESTVQVTVNVAPHFVIPSQPQNMSVVEGSMLFLHCSATGTPTPTYGWTLDGQDIDMSPSGYSLLSNGTLRIQRVQLKDDGDYTCTASNLLGSPKSAVQTVTVHVKPHIVFPQRSFPLNFTIPTGISIGCTAVGIPRPMVEWRLGDTNEIVTDGTKYTLTGDVEQKSSKDVFRVLSNLTIRNPITNDTRPYICSATNPTFQGIISEISIHVIVLVIPTFISPPNSVTVLQTRQGFLQCVASAAPVSTIEWRRNGTILPFNSRYDIRNSSVDTSSIIGRPFITTSNLTITDSRYTDTGIYSCRTINAVGEANSSGATLVVQVAPQISSHPISQTRNMSDSVRFSCASTGVPAPNITWNTTGHAPISSLAVDNTVSGAESTLFTTTSYLQVNNLQKTYDGNFTCTASNGVEQPAVSNPALLTVQVKPTLVPVNKSLIGVEYMSLNLTVNILNAFPNVKGENIEWTNSTDNTPFATSSDTSSPAPFYQSYDDVKKVAHLVVKNVSLDSGGGYRCTATNEAGSESVNISVAVQGPPKFVDRPSDTKVIAGTLKVELHCDTSSVPAAEFVWTKEGKIVSDGSVSRFSLKASTPGEGILVITNVMYDDWGEYKCTATNEHGFVAAAATLEVQVAPVIDSPPTPNIITIEPSMTIFNCNASGQPQPTISWKRKLAGSTTEEKLMSSGNFTIQADNSLIISATRFEDRGVYTCVATNNLVETRSDEADAQLTVHVHPKITVLPQDVTVVSLSNITVQCEAQGYPLPMLTWQHDGQQVVTNEPKQSVFSNQPDDIQVMSTLLVRMSDFKDRGLYKCVVKNLVGEDQAKATVVVQYPAVITDKPTSMNVRKPRSLSLFCKARGFPIPSIQWYKGNSSVLPTSYNAIEMNGTNQIGVPTLSSNLTIKQTKTSDTGEFTCLVTNVVSTQLETVQVRVQEVPFAPTDVNITNKTARTVSLSWTAPFNGNMPIIKYTVQYPGVIEVTMDSKSSITVGKLHPYRNYTFTVAATNNIGTGNFSDPSPQVETNEAAPDGEPKITSVVPESSESVRIQWKAVPADDQNGIIIQHEIEIRKKQGRDSFGKEDVKTTNKSDTFLATELKPFTDYQFRVRAYTVVGPGDYSSPHTTRTPEDAPADPPSNARVTAINSTSVMVTWTEPKIPNGIIRSYAINVTNTTDGTVLYAVVTKSNTTIATVSGLSFYTNYNFTVRAFTVKYSRFSESVTGRSGEHPPSKPLGVKFVGERTETSLMIQWSPPANPYGILKGYRVTLRASKMYMSNGEPVEIPLRNITNINNNNARSLQVVNLTPYTKYTAVVQGRTIDLGEFSDEVSLQTLPAEPPLPSPPGVPGEDAIKNNPRLAATPGSFSVYLSRGSTINGPISHYQLIVLQLIQTEIEKTMDVPPPLPDKPPSSYSQNDLMRTYNEAKQSATPVPYITAEFDYNLFPTSGYFTVGSSDQPNDNPAYTNGPVNEGSFYSVFLRAFTDTGGSRRKRVPLSQRQYNLYSSSQWGPVSQTSFKSSTSTGIIAGTVVAVVVVAIIVLVILILSLRRRMRDAEKRYITDVDAAFVDSVEDIGEVPRVGTPSIRLRQMSTVKRNPAAVSYDGPAPVPLSQFAEHVERMHSNGNYVFKQEYEAIQKLSPKHPAEVGTREANKAKNRYANILCFDHTRFKLKPIEDEEGSDYINANYLDGFRRQNAYIATQGVVPATVDDFWRMVWESNSKTIVMITKLKEQGRDKCHQYWPNENVSETHSTLTVENVDEIELSDHVVRTFEVTNKTREQRTVKQFHFTMWPDHGVPQFYSPLLAFMNRVRFYNPKDDPAGPIIVHCSAGVGRTGTFIVIDTQLQNADGENTVDIYNFVTRIREQRNFMVQTEDQYVFVHDAVLEALISGKTEVSSQNLRKYIENLKRKDADTDQNGFERQFKLLANSKERANQSHYKQANLEANKKKNRMVNILPYDSSRVCLQISPGVEGSDYINASFIDGYQVRCAFIATQGPIQETVPDFWRMLWENNSNIVVMLTKLVEKGQERCAQYWPTTQAGRFGALLVTLENETPGKSYVTREFTVMNTKESLSRTVTQFHYTAWPESGVPNNGAALLDLIGQVQRVQQKSGNGPITVHDSTGVGRTGTFITLSVCVERLKAENVVDVFQTVKLLRTQRPFMVQTTAQLTFCYKTIIEYLDSFDIYSNFK